MINGRRRDNFFLVFKYKITQYIPSATANPKRPERERVKRRTANKRNERI
ncbi:MAG: hypothetical protein ACD_50C00327G0002 [uncultured bacterium]|nr:MAG: hypothetical protein ACD_50C00327G0002 [uncultured bacterium]